MEIVLIWGPKHCVWEDERMGLSNQNDFSPLFWGGELEQRDCWEILQAENVFCSGPPRKTAVKFSVNSMGNPPQSTMTYSLSHREAWMALPQYQVNGLTTGQVYN